MAATRADEIHRVRPDLFVWQAYEPAVKCDLTSAAVLVGGEMILVDPIPLTPMAICFAWAVEFMQLYHAHWIDGIRATRLGRVVLGTTFNSPDLLAYAVGIAVGALVERVILKFASQRTFPIA